jgi:N-acetylneuraminate synthase
MILVRDVAGFLVLEDEPVETALRRISANKSRAVFVVAADGRLVGSLTDGDFRRWLVGTDSPSLAAPSGEVAHRECTWVRQGDPSAKVDSLFTDAITMIPVVDDRHRVVAVARPRVKELVVDGRRIATDEPAFVIAEIGINHNGSLDTALRLVDAAAAAGADCAKFQMRDMSALYRDSASGLAGEDLGAQYTLDLLAESTLTTDEMLTALDHVREVGLVPLCTPWDEPSVRILDNYGLPAFKVASADLTNHALLETLGGTARPLIVSTGMSTEDEIVESVALLRGTASPFALLQCNSAYPSPYKDVHLRYMDRLAEIGDCLVGYSGHERGFHVALAAVARGARIVEKHITLDRSGRGNDHVVSLEPADFGRLVRQVRDIEEALGSGAPRVVNQGEALNRLSLAKSLVAARDLPAGHTVSDEDLDVRSPGRGLQPNARTRLVGTVLDRAVPAGDFFYEADLRPLADQPRAYTFDRPWGLPVRFHDWRDLASRSNPDFLEFHLSYRDMDMDLDEVVPEPLDLDLTVHSPDLFTDDHILDLASDDDDARSRSIVELQRVIDLTRALAPRFRRASEPIVIVSMGGSSMDHPLPVAERPRRYQRVADAVAALDTSGVRLIAQTLPPYPWYLGGQRHCNLFVDPFETAAFSGNTGIRLCLDTAHTKLACNHARIPFSEAVEALAPYSDHLHLVDAAGLDGEGLQVGEGEIDWPVLMDQLDRLAPKASFIPEIWQGHVGGGQGFWTALERLERLGGQA